MILGICYTGLEDWKNEEGIRRWPILSHTEPGLLSDWGNNGNEWKFSESRVQKGSFHSRAQSSEEDTPSWCRCFCGGAWRLGLRELKEAGGCRWIQVLFLRGCWQEQEANIKVFQVLICLRIFLYCPLLGDLNRDQLAEGTIPLQSPSPTNSEQSRFEDEI